MINVFKKNIDKVTPIIGVLLLSVFIVILGNQNHLANELASANKEFDNKNYAESLLKYRELLNKGFADLELVTNYIVILSETNPDEIYEFIQFIDDKDVVSDSELEEMSLFAYSISNNWLNFQETYQNSSEEHKSQYVEEYISSQFILENDLQEGLKLLRDIRIDSNKIVVVDLLNCMFIENYETNLEQNSFCKKESDLTESDMLQTIYLLAQNDIYGGVIYFSNKLTRILPDFYQSYLYKGIALSNLNIPSEARNYFLISFEKQPNDLQLQRLLVSNLVENQDYETLKNIIGKLSKQDYSVDKIYTELLINEQYEIVVLLSEKYQDNNIIVKVAKDIANTKSVKHTENCRESIATNYLIQDIYSYKLIIDYLTAQNICTSNIL